LSIFFARQLSPRQGNLYLAINYGMTYTFGEDVMTSSPSLSRREAESYDFAPGCLLARKYQVLSRIEAGSSGELYTLSECATGIERMGKFFSRKQNPARMATFYAQKLHRLRHCDILMQYRTQETISVGGTDITFLISDAMHGAPLLDFLANEPGSHLSLFEGLYLLHALAAGVEPIHAAGEHHGELTLDNILVRRKGLGFRAKLIDLSPGQSRKTGAFRQDVLDMIRLFAIATAASRFGRKFPKSVQKLLGEVEKSSSSSSLRDAGALRQYLETLSWSSSR
jgi:hypothetical protein